MIYPDSAHNIEEKLISCYDRFAVKIFGSMQSYREAVAVSPQWVMDAGNSSECAISKVRFEALYLEHSNNPLLNRLLYYYDCENLISSLQNIAIESFHLSHHIHRIMERGVEDLAGGDTELNAFTGHRFLSGETVVELFSLTNMLFINLYSQLDYVTKLFYEL